MNELAGAAFAFVERSLALSEDRIVAVALLTQGEVDSLGIALKHCYPVPAGGTFDHLLAQLDGIEVEGIGNDMGCWKTSGR
ncbi:hypothetical protein [Sphingobium sp. CR28]|uniref:hypothetical protein n=1 Tax=Sphingobium sp. CR28 TaxID=3400272 RepID=UPI003FEF99D9